MSMISVIKVLSKDLYQHEPNYREGGLVGWQASFLVAVQFPKLDVLLPPVLHYFDDRIARAVLRL
jgi:hypothetical protein